MNAITLSLAALAGSLGVFWFVAECLDPFHLPTAPLKRKRVRLGRKLAAGFAFAALAAIWIGTLVGLTLLGMMVLAVPLFGLAAVPSLRSFKREGRLWGFEGDR